MRTWNSSLFRLTGSDLKLCSVPRSLQSESTKCLFIYQETPKADGSPSRLLVLSPWPLTGFEWKLSNTGRFKSEHWGDDNILSVLWIFHFVPAEAKHIMWVKSQSLWVWTEGRENMFQLLFAIQRQPPWEPWAAITPYTLISSGASGESSGQLRCSVWNYILSRDFKLLEPLCLSVIRGYTDMRVLLLSFVLFRVNDPWHLAKITWLSSLGQSPRIHTHIKAFSRTMLQLQKQVCVIRRNGLRLRNTSHQHQRFATLTIVYFEQAAVRVKLG